ncbi:MULTISPECIES: ATP-grasp domain-containing protein [Okeania]|uniref:ATP-grasp domain-containing protein n=1 Tax=Okeania hirsuta TaxID=1458930 RepID=A0A3N6P113_9CYAN|nr:MULTISPECIES: hypothetical protein [Okeania]NES88777.1 hypothetical protein [Okeania sp. SIO2B9]RQH25710.1 hypothetical protein D4Z78_02215 [Okeania hirsuta]RQH51441.1 hypothetical protein D5R40_05600 [Okeania hirsuta]
MIKSADGKCLLIAGGQLDPNLTRLIEIAQSQQVPICEVLHGQEESPEFSWHLTQGQPTIKDRVVSATGAFIRYDVFGNLSAPKSGASQRASGWYQTLYGWLLSQPQIRLFNRNHLPAVGNKPAMLILAQKLGLLIPDTLITNEAEELGKYSAGSAIAKPVAGGDFCYSLEQLHSSIQFRNGCAAMPAIVQNRLVAPEIRIYIVGNFAFAFEIRSQHLDYRVQPDAEIIPLATLPDEVELLRKFMANLRMDFGAADFKTDPKTKKLVFLELNSSPMFVRFDQVVKGSLCEAMIETLIG